MITPRQAWFVWRYMGPKWIAFRLKYELQKRSGYLAKRAPPVEWCEVPLQNENPTALGFVPRPTAAWRDTLTRFDFGGFDVIEEADAILKGRFTLFSYHRVQLGFPPNWNVNALTGETYSDDTHWSQIRDFSGGDIKAVWECSRFPWAFVLGRAYARTGDDRYAEGFWKLFNDWLRANPPNRGPQWKCGQEASFRLFASVWARQVFSNSPSTIPESLKAWRRFVYATGQRIAANLDYALSQSNNHGISECVALLTVCRILPGIPEVAQWEARACDSLVSQVRTLVYPDGAFSQHSTVYHRVLLHDLCWLLAIESANGKTVDEEIVAACRRAWQYLRELTDAYTGEAPLAGANDGSNVLPLSNSSYLDFRPAIQLASVLTDSVPAFRSGQWDESVLWLANGKQFEASRASEAPKRLWSAPYGGWTILRKPLTRLAFNTRREYKHRPGHADLLHVDIWWRDQWITRDPGSYSYNTKRPQNGFLSTRVHNTIEVQNQSQMEKVSRFLVLPWPSGSVEHDDETLTVRAGHNAYRRFGVVHSRTVQQTGSESWIVADDLHIKPGDRSISYQLHWLFGDSPYSFDPDRQLLTLHLSTGDYSIKWQTNEPTGATLMRAHELSDRGWWSPHYLDLQPALSLAIHGTGDKGLVNLRTAFGPTTLIPN